MERRVYSFSVKRREDVELMEKLKRDCELKRQNFSAVLINLVRESLDERPGTSSQSNI
jgi:hypothetical protein